MAAASRGARQPRRRRRAIRALLLTQVLLASLYAWLIPVFEGPDADGHLGYIVQQQADGLARAPLNADSAALSHEIIQQPPFYYRAAAILASPADAARTVAIYRPNPYYPGLSHRVSIGGIGEAAVEEWPARVAVWLSLLGAVMAAAASFALARCLWPSRPFLALAATAVLAFNPQFLQSAATVSNDALAAGITILAVALAARLTATADATTSTRTVDTRGIRGPTQRWGLVRQGLGLGLVAGAAALTKYSGLLLLAPVALMLLRPTLRRWRSMLPAMAAGVLAWTVVAGPWFLATWRESGQFVPTDLMHRLLPDLTRQPAASWATALRETFWLGHSYWGVFGHGFLADASYYRFIAGLMLLAILGLLLNLGRAVAAGRWSTVAREFVSGPWVWILLWLVVKYGAILAWIRGTQFANQGRLLFGAAPAVALLLVIGWRSLLPGRERQVSRLVVVVMAALAVSQLATLTAAFRPAPALAVAHPKRPAQAAFAPGMRVLGADVDTPTVKSGGTLDLRLYWTTTKPIQEDAMTYVHLVDDSGNKLAAVDQVPLAGRHPTRSWRPGEVFAERWRMPVAEVVTDTLAQLVLGAYADEDPGRPAAVADSDGTPLGNELRLGHVLVRPAEARDGRCALPPPPAGAIQWRAGLILEGFAAEAVLPAPPLRLALCWSSLGAPQRDLQLFVQLLDEEDRILAQWDGPPAGGRRPTATWMRGSRLQDTIRMAVADGADPAAWRRVILGWYDPVSGRREPLRDGRDHAVLLERR